MSPEQIQAILSGLSFRGLYRSMRTWMKLGADERVSVYFELPTFDVVTGEPQPLNGCMYLDAFVMDSLTPGHLMDLIRRQLHTLVIHEMDEAIHFDGNRVFDPHRDEWKVAA